MSDLAAEPGEDLEDGHRGTTPAGDNLLLDFARAESVAYRDLLVPAGAIAADDEQLGLHMCDLGSPSPFGNVALLSRPIAGDEVHAVVAATRDHFGAREGGPYLLFSPWPIAPLDQHGFQPVGHPPMMIRPPDAAQPPALDVRIEAVTDADGLAEFEHTFVDAYPEEALQPWTRGALLHPDVLDGAWRFFVARDGDDILGTAASYIGDRITVIEFVSTRPEARGRGIGAALTLTASTVAPDQPAGLISSDDGRGVYGGLGYLPILRYTLWMGTR